MHITKKFDRAFQWAGEKMGQEAKTGVSDEFKMLETEMALRHDGMDKLQKSMNVYTKSLSKRCDASDDKEKALPVSFLGRTMISHGEDFEQDSEFGNCLIAMGQGNERVAGLQETYSAQASSYWLEGCERNLAMMKEYQNARKKLENRRLAYDASTAKLSKSKREDPRLEDELRSAKAKYEESSEDVYRRMQDIKEAEAEAIQDLTNFMDAELEYYERCAEELRRVRANWPASTGQISSTRGGHPDIGLSRRTTRSRSNTARSYSDRNERTESWASRQDIYEDEEPAPAPVRMPIRTVRQASSGTATPISPPRPGFNRSSTHGGTFEGPRDRPSYREPPLPPPSQESLRKSSVPSGAVPINVGSLRGNLRPVSRISTNTSQDVFADEYDGTTSSGSPDYARSESPATSYGSLSRTTSNTGLSIKKAPPPPPPSRAKKPPPPIPQKREMAY
ncbi:hypothetical protein BJ166DRAFT_112920 [Pestalotiopsis sp. NC0098]|nr:hypothetical protein BJ166DRAFT_112920 [Pestalotiopsis sp. NC0098]